MALKTLFIASDHAGFNLKTLFLQNRPDLPWNDLGPFNADRVDYPDYADKLVHSLLKASESSLGILICGSGQGMSMRANKYTDIRAALCWNEESAALARAHNNANVLCLGSRIVQHNLCLKILDSFLKTEFEGGRHLDRVLKVSKNTVS